VTLKRHGELRAASVTSSPWNLSTSSVQENAVNAASRDTRFLPLRSEELAAIEIEISALTKPVPSLHTTTSSSASTASFWKKAHTRRSSYHRSLRNRGGSWRRPQTPFPEGRTAPEAWKDPGTRFMIFTAEVFQEGEQAGAGP